MRLSCDAMWLRIFVGGSNRYGHRPLYEAIVLQARVIDSHSDEENAIGAQQPQS